MSSPPSSRRGIGDVTGELKIIAAILERPVIEKILTHLGLDPQPPPPRVGARGGAGLKQAAWAAPAEDRDADGNAHPQCR